MLIPSKRHHNSKMKAKWNVIKSPQQQQTTILLLFIPKRKIYVCPANSQKASHGGASRYKNNFNENKLSCKPLTEINRVDNSLTNKMAVKFSKPADISFIHSCFNLSTTGTAASPQLIKPFERLTGRLKMINLMPNISLDRINLLQGLHRG